MPLPLPGSAVGNVLLSQMSKESFANALTGMRLSARSQAELRKRLEQIREVGFAESVNDSVDGIRGVAVPIGDEDNGGAVSVSGPSDRFTGDQVPLVLDRLRYAARVIEEAGIRLQDLRFS
jgi:DNA-binding IclR family transcriptional regulator